MVKRIARCGLRAAVVLTVVWGLVSPADAQNGAGQPTDWQRFYYYPYVYYPHNFQQPQQFDSLYYRYPAARRIPVYNKDWHNFYPTEKPWHKGYTFILDVF